MTSSALIRALLLSDWLEKGIRQLFGTGFDPQGVSLFMNIPEEMCPVIASNQRRTAGLSPGLGRNPSKLGIGLGLIPD